MPIFIRWLSVRSGVWRAETGTTHLRETDKSSVNAVSRHCVKETSLVITSLTRSASLRPKQSLINLLPNHLDPVNLLTRHVNRMPVNWRTFNYLHQAAGVRQISINSRPAICPVAITPPFTLATNRVEIIRFINRAAGWHGSTNNFIIPRGVVTLVVVVVLFNDDCSKLSERWLRVTRYKSAARCSVDR